MKFVVHGIHINTPRNLQCHASKFGHLA